MQKVFRAYWPSIRKHLWLLLATLITMVIGILLKALAPYYIRDIVTVFTSTPPNPDLAWKAFNTLLWISAGIFIIYRFFEWTMALYEAKVITDLDKRSFAALQAQSIRFFENHYAGSLTKQVVKFSSAFEDLSDLIFFELGRDAIMLVIIGIILTQAMPQLALWFGLWTIIYLTASYVAAIWKYPLDRASADSDSTVIGALADSISNHLTVKSFGQEGAEEKLFDHMLEDNYHKRIRSWQAGNLINGIQAILGIIAEVGLTGWMIRNWQKGLVSTGDFIFLQTYTVWLLTHLWTFGRSIRKVFSSLANAEEMAEIYRLTPEVKDAPSAHPITIQEGLVTIHALSFSYGAERIDSRHTLNNLNLTIEAGQSVGFVGKTGAGKSTLGKLVLRLYDPNSGYICVDMQDIANVTQRSLRQQIAVVHQQPQLFHRSIKENIRLARPDANEADIIEAAKSAYAWEFIEKLPHGLDTMVGERGVKLSGGQCQRIAIARAILADPKILILDEATSSLDSQTEKYIQKAVTNLLSKRTSLVIAHRLSTLVRLDRIIVLNNGEIIEDGTHEELLAHEGEYANLWKHQTDAYIS